MNARSAIVLLAAGAAALVAAAPLAASPPTEGTGVGTVLLRSITESRDADGNVIQVRQANGTLSGAFDGIYAETVRGVIHKDGIVTFHGLMTFTGVAGDCGAGTVLLEFEGKAIAGLPVSEGRLRTIDHGDGTTVPVHVVGTFTETATTFAYAGTFHCD
jgi:hypothetical protein